MSVRVLVTLAVVVLAPPAGAQPARSPWHAVVVPPRQSFPTVTIDLGYPGPYIPWANSPITLQASAGDYPFDGYIGFHFRVNDHLTYDTPVISRAVLKPHEQWTFTTFARLRRYGGLPGEAGIIPRILPREIDVEWRNRAMRVVTVRNGGVPPWQYWTEPLRPLVVIAPEEKVAERVVLGRAGWVERAHALSDQAQWYVGFSDAVVPLGVWLDLPRRIREAMFGSGIHFVFFGFARPDQPLDDIDLALLPVVFTANAGSYNAPWPYRQSRVMPVATPVSWTSKGGASVVGGGRSPYIVQNEVAAWTADEIGVSHPLPAMTAIPIRLRTAVDRSGIYNPNAFRTEWPGPAQLLRMFPAPALSVAALIVSISAWMAMRKRMSAAGMLVLAFLAAFILAARDRIRPPAGAYDMEIRAPVASGIINHVHARRVYGPQPISEESVDAERIRTSVTGGNDWGQEAEVRTSKTPVTMGMMKNMRDWDAISRWSIRRELGEPPAIRIRSRDAKKLVLEYESPIPVNYIQATWTIGDAMYHGGRAVPEQKSGTVAIAQGSDVPEEILFWQWDMPGSAPAAMHPAVVVLAQKNRSRFQWLSWYEPVVQEKSFTIAASATQENAGSFSWTFALPLESTSADATALISVGTPSPSSQVNISWGSGTATLRPTGRQGLIFGSPSYAVPPAVLGEILNGGGIVKLTIRGEQREDRRAWIEVWEKKS